MKHWLGLIMLGLAASTVQADLVLARRGTTPDTVIVHAADAGDSIKLACTELQTYVERQTGVKLPIQDDKKALPPKAVLVGKPRYLAEIPGCQFPDMAMPDDSFCLKTVGQHLVIYGGKRGALYGVFEILERFGGCRWYASWCEKAPQLDAFVVPSNLDDRQIPAFLMREPFWYDMFNTTMAYRNKCNGNQMHLNESQGGKVRFGSGLFVHTMQQFIPVEEFYKTHPEYFPEIGGKRVDGYVQRCLTNPDVLKITQERLLERIRKDPTATMYSVSQNDVYSFCTCKECNAMAEKFGGQAGLMIWFVNQVAEAVEKEFPNALIETLAYQYTRTPPVNIKPRHNVVPRLCTIECDFSTPLDVSTHKQNVKFVDDIKGWSSMTDKLFIWDYTTDFSHYLCPFPNFACLQGNVKFFRDNHVIGLMEQGAYQGYHAEFSELRGWLLAKLLWNPDQPIEPLYDDFFNGYYGKAAPLVRKYFDELQSLVAAPETSLVIWAQPSSPWLTDDFLNRSLALWTQAEALVKDDRVSLYNVRKSSIPIYFAIYSRMVKPHPEYRWTENSIEPVITDQNFKAIVTELITRFDELDPSGTKRPIRIRENQSSSITEYQQWSKYTKSYQAYTIGDAGWSAAVASELGGYVGLFNMKGLANDLNEQEGGFNLTDQLDRNADSDPLTYSTKVLSAKALELSATGKDIAIDKTISLNGGTLCFSTDMKNTGKTTRKMRPTMTLALSNGKGKALGLRWKLDDGAWQSFEVPAGTLLDYTAIDGTELAGKKQLSVETYGSGRCVTLQLDDVKFERIVFQIGSSCGVRLLGTEATAEVAVGASLTRSVELAVTPGTTAPIAAVAVNAPERIVYEDCAITIHRRGQWGDTVFDAEASDKSALKLYNTHFEWCIQLRPNRAMVKADKSYTVRARVKVVPRGTQGEAFWCGIYNTATRTYPANLSIPLKSLKPGYQWYDISKDWHPQSADYIWMGPPRFTDGKSPVEGVYLDRIEFIENK